MKRYLTLIFILSIGFTNVQAWDFAEPNQDGDTIYYIIDDETTVSLDRWVNFPDNMIYEVDTFRLPETVTHEGVTYQINYDYSKLILNFGFLLDATKASPRTLLLPQDYSLPTFGAGDVRALLQILGRTKCDRLENWAIENGKYLTSINGILYSRNKDTLIAYPPKRTGSFRVPQRVVCITTNAFLATNIDTLILPDKDLELRIKFINEARRMRTFRYPDYITHLNDTYFTADSLREIIFGADLKYIGSRVLPNTTVLEKVICRAITPPTTGFTNFDCTEEMALYVPRVSVGEYKRAKGWSSFQHILPIEPPIVTGLSSAEVSWVQNFSATGYIWTLYLDEAKTQRFMSMTFDAIGHLTNIDFGSNLAPKRAPALYNGDDEENRYAEYYSFTITGLSPDTKYYYTRQSLNGDEVIDEENGSFKTQNDEVTGLKNYETETSALQKYIENGQMFIEHYGKTYSVTGQEVK